MRSEMLGDPRGRLLRIAETPLHHVRIGEEMQVVGVVHHSVEPIRIRHQIPAIGGGARCVRGGGPGMIAGTGVDVRRHV